jgi:hypothetical protein
VFRSCRVFLNIIKNSRELEQHVNLAPMATTFDKTIHHLHHPRRALATGCALPTRFMLVELIKARRRRKHSGGKHALLRKKRTHMSKTRDGGNDIGRLVHNNHRARAETGLSILERIKVHTSGAVQTRGQTS